MVDDVLGLLIVTKCGTKYSDKNYFCAVWLYFCAPWVDSVQFCSIFVYCGSDSVHSGSDIAHSVSDSVINLVSYVSQQLKLYGITEVSCTAHVHTRHVRNRQRQAMREGMDEDEALEWALQQDRDDE